MGYNELQYLNESEEEENEERKNKEKSEPHNFKLKESAYYY